MSNFENENSMLWIWIRNDQTMQVQFGGYDTTIIHKP